MAEAVIQDKMISFRAGGQNICIPVSSVREIRSWTAPMPIPNAPSYILGIVDLRGSVLPIIDFAAKVGLLSPEPTDRHAIIVLEYQDESVGLYVEGVSEIFTLSSEQIQPLPEMTSAEIGKSVAGVALADERMVSVVLPASMFPEEESALA